MPASSDADFPSNNASSLPPHLRLKPAAVAPPSSPIAWPVTSPRTGLDPTAPAPTFSPKADPRRKAFPFSHRRHFQPNPSSTKLVSSTAEGKPIPVDDSTAEHRTLALRELSTNYPSRHRYAKSTGAENSTYSEPVIVRSYYSPSPSRPASNIRGGILVGNNGGITMVGSSGSGSRRAPSHNGSQSSALRRVIPFANSLTSAGNGMLSNMTRSRPRTGTPEDARLPPVEAFSFKSFMSNMEAQDGGDDINADLDRIAEICARSKYSLSNQYEVHYAPHGSGSSFLETAANPQESQGPTLQVVSSDDERSMRQSKKRRSGARRRSRAMGTLETIMSSSRSSDEDKSKKKSAAEIAEEVRGRAARKESTETSPTLSSQSTFETHTRREQVPTPGNHPGRSSASSLALIDGRRQSPDRRDAATPRASATGLVSQPALPQASPSHLEIRTAPDGTEERRFAYITTAFEGLAPASTGDPSTSGSGTNGRVLSALSSWVPWRLSDGPMMAGGRAEGSLRDLLRSSETKGKGAEQYP